MPAEDNYGGKILDTGKINKFLHYFSIIIGIIILTIGLCGEYLVVASIIGDGSMDNLRLSICSMTGFIFIITGGLFIFEKIKVKDPKPPQSEP